VLRRIELEVLSTVDRGDTISELAMKLDHSESYLSRAVADLVEKGVVYTERDGRRKRVVPSDARAVERYQDLVRQHSHIDFPELLTGKALEVLYYLDQPRTVSEIADRSDNYRNTVNRVLKRFRDRGLVGTADGHYEFNADFDRLHELPVKSHTICTVTASKPLPRRARFSGRTTTNSSPRPKRRSMRRRSTKPASLDSRPSTSSSCSPIIATTSTPRNPTQSRRRSSAVTRC